MDDWYTRADGSKIAPIIAVPTTAGTGSEVGRAGVLTNAATHKKKIIFHPKLLPVVTICDPALTVGMPRFITAGTGMDALAHCLEAYCSPFYHPMSQGIALEGMRLVFENLPKVYANPNDLDAVSYTHLDVYKRQIWACPWPSVAPISPGTPARWVWRAGWRRGWMRR